MRRLDTLRPRPPAPEARFLSFQEYVNLFGRNYALQGSYGLTPEATFVSYVRDVGERNGVVSAAVAARALLISQLRFIWKNNRLSNTPGRTFGDARLSILENPGTLTRPALLHLAEKHVSYGGGAYLAKIGNRLAPLRPDGVKTLLGSDSDPENDWVPSDAQIVGYAYRNPKKPGSPIELFGPEEVIAWVPEPHAVEWWRGESWVTSIISEIRNDGQASDHTSKFFENAATPQLVFTMDPTMSPTEVTEYAQAANDQHAGVHNAYKNLYIGGGAKVDIVGAENAALNLRDITGGYEARIASRSRVPAVVLGIREGMQGSALNSGNYGQTRRLMADGWFTPAAQSLAAAAARVLPSTPDADLAHDPSEVLFLQEDRKDEAEVQLAQATAMRQLVDAGYDPATVVEAIQNNDLGRLQHSGLYSVQLQPPADGTTPPEVTE